MKSKQNILRNRAKAIPDLATPMNAQTLIINDLGVFFVKEFRSRIMNVDLYFLYFSKKYVMRHILTIWFLLISTLSIAQSKKPFDQPIINPTGKALVNFVPIGWKAIDSACGDLNKDSLSDLAIIIENTDEKYFFKNEHLGEPVLNANPRLLLILFQKKHESGYKLVTQNSSFIPPPNDTASPCLADPLSETQGITIKNGILELHFKYWMSCGSWFTSDHNYLFRYQNMQFELIGFNSSEFHRASGEMSEYSINFSTKKLSYTTGGNMFEETEINPKTIWRKFKLSHMINLQTMGSNTFDHILKILDQK